MLLLIHFCKRFVEQEERKTEFGKAINSFFLWTGCSSNFCANCLFKNILMHISTKVVWKEYFFNT